MKKFILKTSLFVLPFFALFGVNKLLFNQTEGDLVRVGYLYSNPSPKSLIVNQYVLTKHYTLLSEIDLTIKRKFDVITIGDSFSEQDSLGYKNFIGSKGISVLHIDRFIAGENPIQTLIQLLNSDFFDCISADYIVLQSAERSFNNRNKELDFDMTIKLSTLLNQMNNYNQKTPNYNLQFFSDATVKAPLANIQYCFEPKPSYSKTYKFKSKSNHLFSNSPADLLFYEADINNLNNKNDSVSIFQSIENIATINELVAKKNMELILLISPDKYDLYYQYIANNEMLPKPLFFSVYDSKAKTYKNIDSYKILSEKVKKGRDVYFYDDAHWSPKGAEIIADEILDIIKK
jgi:hypothetical protein